MNLVLSLVSRETRLRRPRLLLNANAQKLRNARPLVDLSRMKRILHRTRRKRTALLSSTEALAMLFASLVTFASLWSALLMSTPRASVSRTLTPRTTLHVLETRVSLLTSRSRSWNTTSVLRTLPQPAVSRSSAWSTSTTSSTPSRLSSPRSRSSSASTDPATTSTLPVGLLRTAPAARTSPSLTLLPLSELLARLQQTFLWSTALVRCLRTSPPSSTRRETRAARPAPCCAPSSTMPTTTISTRPVIFCS
mmetsp:Transcript_13211/g.25570  ORF Transcript_13211/g.25570 Transcript_13211/m.25570 type:complete len:251 (+) Transcript_13211:1611-2363(+)